MAQTIIRNASVYVAGVKVAEAQTAELDIASNGQPALGDGTVLGHTQAPFTGSISIKKWNTVAGTASGTKLTAAFFERKIVTVNYGIDDGGLWKVPCTVLTYKTSSDMAKGSCEGDWTMGMAGDPKKL